MNKVVLMGRLTKDPELRFASGSGLGVCRFTVAVNRRKKKDEDKAEADFISCVAFGKTAETISQYIAKGNQILLEGHIQTGNYDAQDGTKRYTTDVNVERFEFIGNKSGNSTSSNDSFGAGVPDDVTPVDDGDMPF